MKKQLILFLIVLLTISFGCIRKDETDKAWEKVDEAMDKEKLQSAISDTLNVRTSRTSFEVARDIKNLFESRRTRYNDSTLINLSSLRDSILQIEEIPDTCRKVTVAILNGDDNKIHLDSAEAKILECIFGTLIEK